MLLPGPRSYALGTSRWFKLAAIERYDGPAMYFSNNSRTILLQRQMHVLVPAILFQMTGPDAFDVDFES
jgi:hypothetical protein